MAVRGDVVGGAVPLPEPLVGLLPQGLRRGDVATVATKDGTPTYLALALLAEPLRRGLWGAAIGVPGLGGLALRELMGEQGTAGLRRLLVVPQPGEAWARVVGVLADGVDVLMVRPPGCAAGSRRSYSRGARRTPRTARCCWCSASGPAHPWSSARRRRCSPG